MDPLMVPWITAHYGLDGIFYWEINHWLETPNPWLDPVTFITGCRSTRYLLVGEGSLVYPGDFVSEYTGQPDVDGPVSSIRMELLREGIEDYEYLLLFRQHGGDELARETVHSLVVSARAFNRNMEEHYQARQKMARRIEELTD